MAKKDIKDNRSVFRFANPGKPSRCDPLRKMLSGESWYVPGEPLKPGLERQVVKLKVR
jgi:hypothetical protein